MASTMKWLARTCLTPCDFRVASPGSLILPSVDARRGEVYAALYRGAPPGEEPRLEWGPEAIRTAALSVFASLRHVLELEPDDLDPIRGNPLRNRVHEVGVHRRSGAVGEKEPGSGRGAVVYKVEHRQRQAVWS